MLRSSPSTAGRSKVLKRPRIATAKGGWKEVIGGIAAMAAKAGAEPREQRVGCRKSRRLTRGRERCTCASPLETCHAVLCARTMEGPMRHVVLGVSALALALSGCSYFQGHSQGSAEAAQQNANSPAAAASNSTAAQQNPTRAAAQPSRAGSARGMAGSGSSGIDRSQVKQAQQELQSQGLYKGKIDGILGSETKQALKEFQQKNGLQQTGSLDQRTLAALSGAGESTGSSTPPSGSSSPGAAPGAANTASPAGSGSSK